MSLSRSLYLILALFLAIVTASAYRSHLFAIHFVDEDDNIVIGNYVSEGRKLYSEIFSQHQPSMFVISGVIQQTFSLDNVLMVIKRHRQFMVFWSIVWFLILTARFGWPLLLSVAVIELVKITLLGNLFLAESLVIYPLLYLVAYLFTLAKHPSVLEQVFLALIFALLWFSLTPLWPVLILLAGMIGYQFIQGHHFPWIFLIVGVVSLVSLASLTHLSDYFYQALYINYQYYIPLTTPVGFFESISKAFLAPLMAIFSGKSGELLLLVRILSVGLIINLVTLIAHKQTAKAALIAVILGLTSLRYIDPANTLYGAFHMLPWFALLVVFNFLNFPKIRLPQVLLFAFTILASVQVASLNLFDHRDPATDYYVHFSPSSDVREAVKIIAQSGGQPTLWVEPVMYWPHWQTGVTPYTKMVFYYGWMDQTAPLRQELATHLSTSLPTIVWAETQQGIGPYLDHYVNLTREGKPTNLYLIKDYLPRLTPAARTELGYYRFEIN